MNQPDTNKDDPAFQLWDGNYTKQFYDIITPEGELVKWCWPNAGRMVVFHGNCKTGSFVEGDKIKVRPSPDHPMDF